MPPTLTAFVQTVLQANPFRANRVNSVPTGEADAAGFVDVLAIHNREFGRLQREAQAVRDGGQSVGVLLTGGAGVGKSHLLARVNRWAEAAQAGWCVYLHNILASPGRMPRQCLRSVISELVVGRTSYRDCPLYRMLHDAARAACVAQGLPQRGAPAARVRSAFLHAAEQAPLRRDPLNAQIFEVLYQFLAHVYRAQEPTEQTRTLVRHCIDWLSGEPIPEDAARTLGLRPSPASDDDCEGVWLTDEHHLEQVLLALCALAGMSRRALVICLDQIDNLEPDQLRELARFLHAFLDSSSNLLLVSSGVHEKLLEFRNAAQPAITEAQWDRLAQLEMRLNYCTPAQARELLEARIRPLRERFAAAPELAAHFEAHLLFPLAEKDFELRFGEALDIRPRDALSWAAQSWMEMQDRAAELGAERWLQSWDTPAVVPPVESSLVEADVIDRKVRSALVEAITERHSHPSAGPDADNLALLTERLLRCCVDHPEYSLVGVERVTPAGNGGPAIHLRVIERVKDTQDTAVTGVSFVTASHGTSAAAALRRLLQLQVRLTHRILVTDESRAPLPQTTRAREYYELLLALGPEAFTHIQLDFEQCAKLDALREVIDDAGDLTIEFPRGSSRSLTRDEVIAALHRQRLLVEHPLLQELLTEPAAGVAPPPPSLPPDDLVETIALGLLGWKISVTSQEVAKELLQRQPQGGLHFEAAHGFVVAAIQVLAGRHPWIVKEHLHGLLLMHGG